MENDVIVTHKQLNDELVRVFEAITGLGEGRVLRENYNDRRPKGGLYCTLWFKNASPLQQNDGDFEIDEESGELIQTLRNETLFTAQVSFWGPLAYEAALSAASALQNSERWADLWRIIGYAGIDDVQDISTAYLGQVQPRAFFNFNFYVCLGVKYSSGWFDKSKWRIKEPEHNYTEDFISEGD